MSLRPRICVFVLMACAAIACSDATSLELRGEGRRVLFIGNSYLYQQDIPGLVQAMATAGGEQLAVALLAGPNMALIDHWIVGDAQGEIRKGGWEWVVLQQGPSSVEANRDTLRGATRLFAEEMRAVGATPALFSAWPAQNRVQDFPRAIESYRLAAEDVNGVFLPVASAWLAAVGRLDAPPLYADGLHPSPAGAYLSALVVYACLLQESPTGLPASLPILGGGTFTIPPATATLLQEIASEAVQGVC